MNFSGFIYLDLEKPLVAWETYRGALISANQIETNTQKYPSIILAHMIQFKNNTRLANEFLIEHIRLNDFPERVSRLRGLFLFRDRLSTQKATAWGGHFISENLAEVQVDTKKEPDRLDSNWISKIKRENGIITKDSIDDIRKYWSGEPYDIADPCWEYLINGSALILNTSVRNRAYKIIKARLPASLGLLELSRVALLLNSNLGHCTPWIRRVSTDEFKLGYLMNSEDMTNKSFLNQLKHFKGIKNTQDLNASSELVVPDLSPFFCIFKMSIENLYGYSTMRIHLSD